MKHLIISASLLATLLLSACGSNPQTFERKSVRVTTFPVCPNDVALEYLAETASAQPMTADESEYFWNEIQDRYNCAFGSTVQKQL